MNCSKTFFFFAICAIFLSRGYSQQLYTTQSFLQVSEADYAPQELENFNTPWLEAIDFRTETDEFQFDQQEYRVRIAPNTPRLIKARKEWLQSLQQETLLEKEQFKVQQYLLRLDNWQKLAMLEKLSIVLRERIKILNDQSYILSNNIEDTNKDPLEILTLTNAIEENQATLNALQKQEQELRAVSGLQALDSLSFVDLYSIEKVDQKLSFITQDTTRLNNSLATYDLILNEKETKLERAERAKLIDFFQVNYGSPNLRNIQDGLSIALAFTFPIGDNSMVKLKELELEKRSAEQEIAQNRTNQQGELRNQIAILKQNIEDYQRSGEVYEKTQIKSRFLKEQLKGNQTTLNIRQILKINEYMVQLHYELIKKEESVRGQFVNMLQTMEITDLNYLQKILQPSF